MVKYQPYPASCSALRPEVLLEVQLEVEAPVMFLIPGQMMRRMKMERNQVRTMVKSRRRSVMKVMPTMFVKIPMGMTLMLIWMVGKWKMGRMIKKFPRQRWSLLRLKPMRSYGLWFYSICAIFWG